MLPSKLRMLIPTAGPFFTRLPLEAAFKYQDRKRYISSRRFVAPSFNDVRQILNSAQSMAVTNGSLQLATFDGDVTLYDDGFNLEPSSPVIPRLLGKLVHKSRNCKLMSVRPPTKKHQDWYCHGCWLHICRSLL